MIQIIAITLLQYTIINNTEMQTKFRFVIHSQESGNLDSG